MSFLKVTRDVTSRFTYRLHKMNKPQLKQLILIEIGACFAFRKMAGLTSEFKHMKQIEIVILHTRSPHRVKLCRADMDASIPRRQNQSDALRGAWTILFQCRRA